MLRIKKNKIIVTCLVSVFLIPLFSFAADTSGFSAPAMVLSAPATPAQVNTSLPLSSPYTNPNPSSSGASQMSLGATQPVNLFSSGTSGGTSSSNKATTCNAPKDIGTLFDYARCLLSSSVIPFIIGLGVLLFLIGVVQYVASGDNEEKREASRNMMIYGIIAIFVMVSVWGFVKILTTTFGFDFALPTLPPSKNNPALNS